MRHFRFCVPDEWYRRSKSRNVSPAPGPSESTIRRLAALQESEEDDAEEEEEEEGEGTAKLGASNPSLETDTKKTVEQRGLVTQARLSNMFENWLYPSSPNSSTRSSAVFTPDNRKSVSEPRLMDAASPNIISKRNSSDASEDESEDDFDTSFEEMLVSGCYFSTNVTLMN